MAVTLNSTGIVFSDGSSIASISAGAVGATVYGASSSIGVGSTIAVNTTVAGSSLRSMYTPAPSFYSGVPYGGSGSSEALGMSGTWRAQHRGTYPMSSYGKTSISGNSVTTWIRIS